MAFFICVLVIVGLLIKERYDTFKADEYAKKHVKRYDDKKK